MTDQQPAVTPDDYVRNLRRITPLSRGIVLEAVREMAPEPASVGVDLGCGIGADSVLLGAAVGEGGRVIGVDPAPRMLEEARASAEASGCGQRLDFLPGTLERLPLADGSVDWVWCKDVFWPMSGMVEDSVAALGELRRVLRPGGRLALLYWTSQSLLSGYPRLESLLGTHLTESMPYLAGVRPGRHFLRAGGWMREAGLVDVRARSIATGHLGPMDAALHDSMSCVFAMFFGGIESRLSLQDRALLERITDPGSPEYLPRRSDYYCSLTYSLFLGTCPAEPGG